MKKQANDRLKHLEDRRYVEWTPVGRQAEVDTLLHIYTNMVAGTTQIFSAVFTCLNRNTFNFIVVF